MMSIFSSCSAATQSNSVQSSVPTPVINTIEQTDVQLDAERGTIRFIHGHDLTSQMEKDPTFVKMQAEHKYTEIALAFLKAIRQKLLLVDPENELRLKTVNQDELGMAHIHFEQVYRNIPVLRGDLLVHLNRANQVTSINGSYIPTPKDLNLEPKVSSDGAKQVAAKDVGIASCNTCTSQLVIVPGSLQKPPQLGYLIGVSKSMIEAWNMVIDANTGQVIEKVSTVQSSVN